MLSRLRTFWHELRGQWQGQSSAGHTLLWLLRGCFGAVIISLATLAFDHINTQTPYGFFTALGTFLAILTTGLVIVVTDLLVRSKQITTISAVYFGLLLGLLLGPLFAVALEPFLLDVLGVYLFHGLRLLPAIKSDLSNALRRDGHAGIGEIVGVDAAAITAEKWPD